MYPGEQETSGENPWANACGATAIYVRYKTGKTAFWRVQLKALMNPLRLGVTLLASLLPALPLLLTELNKPRKSVVLFAAFVIGVMFLLNMAFAIISLLWIFSRKDFLAETQTYIGPDGVHDVMRHKTTYQSWGEIRQVLNVRGDLFFLSWRKGCGSV